MSDALKAPIIPALAFAIALALVPLRAQADEHSTAPPAQSAATKDGRTPGASAAHAALDERAELPTVPPALPDRASNQVTPGRSGAAAGDKNDRSDKGDAIRRSHGRALGQAGEDAKAMRAEAAARAAQGSVASAVRNANADAHAAAGQARAAAAKAKANSRKSGTPSSQSD